MLLIALSFSPHRLMALGVPVSLGHECVEARETSQGYMHGIQYRKLTNNMRVIMYIEPFSKFSNVT